jgi:general secretion pathway protein L
MAESLIIRLRSNEAPLWMVCNEDGQVLVNAVSGELMQAVPLAAGRRVVVLVSPGDALVTESEAPAKSAAKLAQVIPFALEERVASEIEDLHFAIGERDAHTGRVPVVAVSRERLDGWVAELRTAGLLPQAIYSEASLVPAMPGQIIGLLDGEFLTLRNAEGPPVVMPAMAVRDALEMLLAAQISQVAGLEPPPVGLLLYASQEDWQQHEHEVDALRERFTGVKVQILPSSSGPLSVLAQAAGSGEAVNILQGTYAPASPLQQGWKAWRIAAALAASLLLVHLGARYFELTRLRKAEAALDASIQDAFRAAMPGQQNALNARRRVEARLAEVRGGGGGGALLPALSALARAKSAVPSASIEGMMFRDGTLELRVNAPDAAALDAIGQQLRASSWQADIKGLTANGDGYRGNLQIRKAGA